MSRKSAISAEQDDSLCQTGKLNAKLRFMRWRSSGGVRSLEQEMGTQVIHLLRTPALYARGRHTGKRGVLTGPATPRADFHYVAMPPTVGAHRLMLHFSALAVHTMNPPSLPPGTISTRYCRIHDTQYVRQGQGTITRPCPTLPLISCGHCPLLPAGKAGGSGRKRRLAARTLQVLISRLTQKAVEANLLALHPHVIVATTESKGAGVALSQE